MNIPYGMKRNMTYLACGVIPVFAVFILALMGLPVIGVYVFTFLIAVILSIMISFVTGNNPWLQTLMGKYIFVDDVNSTGIVGQYNAKAINEQNNRILMEIDFGKRKEYRSYDRRFMKRFTAPIYSILRWKTEEKKLEELIVDLQAGKITKEEFMGGLNSPEWQTLQMHVKRKDLDQYNFATQHFTKMYYNSQTGMCLSKPQMGETEKAFMVEFINMDLLHETRLLNKTLRDFMRHTFDTIMNKIAGILSSPGAKIVIILVIVMVIILVVIMFVPAAHDALLGTAQAVSSTTTNTGIQNIPNTGTGSGA